MLKLHDVSRVFDETAVFADVSVTVDPGEILVVIGPSGVGKTTLLGLLAMFEAPDAGRVTFRETDVWNVDVDRRLDFRRSIGMVFQEPSLFSASVRRNVAYGLRVRNSWRARIRSELAALVGRDKGTKRAVRDALELVGLEESVARDARSLSGGEAQRVGFARALAFDPDIILLDEPTSDLDPRNTAVIEDAVTDARDEGIGVVVATHDMNQARRIADRVAVMLDGGLVEVGSREDVFESPGDERTRKFINGELIY